MKYVPIPVDLLAVGKPLPVDIWSPSGQLLLRKGNPVTSDEHRAKLGAHGASSTESDALAWQRSYERMVHTLLRQGVALDAVSQVPMPSEILESDYVVVRQVQGDWLDLQEVLRGILYQGGLAINPAERLAGITAKAQQLLQADPDDSLFRLFQALADDALGYCATHALLCAVVCELTGQRIGLDARQRQLLVQAALTMNLGMAREQDVLARQRPPPTAWQRKLIADHPQLSAQMLQGYGMDDPDLLDLVRGHHHPDYAEGLTHNRDSRQLLHLTDVFVARMAARRTRSAIAPVQAVKTMVLDSSDGMLGVRSAMAQVVGFFPPGTYVRLHSGEIAVAVQRGERANLPWVVSIVDRDGLPVSRYVAVQTTQMPATIVAPVGGAAVRVAVNPERIRRARERIPR